MSWITGHVLLFILLFVVLRTTLGLPPIPAEDDLNIFDTQYYYAIAKDGYSYDPTHGSNVAFFPAFAWLWQLTGFYTYGIIILNVLIYIFSLSWLAKVFRFSVKETLLYASFPSMMFMYMAYSEPLFFLMFTILLIGLKKDSIAIAATGFFLCSITRSSVNVFIPAIIIMQLLAGGDRKWLKMGVYTFASLAGIALVSYIQHLQTGEWLGFIKTQKYWFHKLQWPHLPFWTWGGKPYPEKEVLWLDGFAFVCGLACVGIGAYYFVRWLRKKQVPVENYILFSLLYLAGLTVLAIAMKGGGLYSLNRYLVPGAAFALLLSRFLRLKFTDGQIWQIMGLIFVLLATTHFFRHIRLILFSLGVLTYFAFFLVYHRPTLQKSAFILAYLTGLAFQLYLLREFLDCRWVG